MPSPAPSIPGVIALGNDQCSFKSNLQGPAVTLQLDKSIWEQPLRTTMDRTTHTRLGRCHNVHYAPMRTVWNDHITLLAVRPNALRGYSTVELAIQNSPTTVVTGRTNGLPSQDIDEQVRIERVHLSSYMANDIPLECGCLSLCRARPSFAKQNTARGGSASGVPLRGDTSGTLSNYAGWIMGSPNVSQGLNPLDACNCEHMSMDQSVASKTGGLIVALQKPIPEETDGAILLPQEPTAQSSSFDVLGFSTKELAWCPRSPTHGFDGYTFDTGSNSWHKTSSSTSPVWIVANSSDSIYAQGYTSSLWTFHIAYDVSYSPSLPPPPFAPLSPAVPYDADLFSHSHLAAGSSDLSIQLSTLLEHNSFSDATTTPSEDLLTLPTFTLSQVRTRATDIVKDYLLVAKSHKSTACIQPTIGTPFNSPYLEKYMTHQSECAERCSLNPLCAFYAFNTNYSNTQCKLYASTHCDLTQSTFDPLKTLPGTPTTYELYARVGVSNPLALLSPLVGLPTTSEALKTEVQAMARGDPSWAGLACERALPIAACIASFKLSQRLTCDVACEKATAIPPATIDYTQYDMPTTQGTSAADVWLSIFKKVPVYELSLFYPAQVRKPYNIYGYDDGVDGHCLCHALTPYTPSVLGLGHDVSIDNHVSTIHNERVDLHSVYALAVKSNSLLNFRRMQETALANERFDSNLLQSTELRACDATHSSWSLYDATNVMCKLLTRYDDLYESGDSHKPSSDGSASPLDLHAQRTALTRLKMTYVTASHTWAKSDALEHCCAPCALFEHEPWLGCTHLFTHFARRWHVLDDKLKTLSAPSAELGEEFSNSKHTAHSSSTNHDAFTALGSFAHFRRLDSQKSASDHPYNEDEIYDMLGSHLDTVCCIVPLTLEARWQVGNVSEHCDRSHCLEDFKRRAIAKQGRRLRHELRHEPKEPHQKRTYKQGRRMEEHPSVNQHDTESDREASRPRRALSAPQQVAVDLLNDHAHPIEGCNHVLSKHGQEDDAHDHVSRAECALRGVAHRVAEYHDIEPAKIMSVFDVLGKNMAEIMANIASVMQSDSDEQAAAHRSTSDAFFSPSATDKRRVLEDRLRRRTREVFGRSLEEDEEMSAASDLDDELKDDVIVDPNEPSEEDLTQTRSSRVSHRLQNVMDTFHAGNDWGLSVAEFAREAQRSKRHNDLVQTQAMRQNDTLRVLADDGIFAHGSTTTFQRTVHRAETVASVVINADGSVVRTARTISSVATTLSSEEYNVVGTIRKSLEATRQTSTVDSEFQTFRRSFQDTKLKVTQRHHDAMNEMLGSGETSSRRRKLSVDQVRRRALAFQQALEVQTKRVDVQSHRWLARNLELRLQNASQHERTSLGRRLERVQKHVGDLENAPMPFDYYDDLDDLGYEMGPIHRMIVEDVDWVGLVHEMHRVIDEERDRMRWWSRGAQGTPPDSTVSRWIGGYLPPSVLGRGLRALGHAIRHGTFPDWEQDGALQRVVERHREATHEERMEVLGLGTQSVTSSRPNPFGSRGRHLSMFDHVTDGRMRGGTARRGLEEVLETFGTGVFGGSLTVPLSEHNADPSRIQNKTADLIEGALSYMIYNVFLCYFSKPKSGEAPASALTPGDGQRVTTRRTNHLCFPAVPLSIPLLPNFTEFTGMDAALIQNKSLEDICGRMIIAPHWVERADGLSDTLGLGSAGRLAMRRLFQNPDGFVTTVRNFGAGLNAATRGERTAHIACALARMNSFLWMVMLFLLITLLYLSVCWPCVNILSMSMRLFCCCCCPGIIVRRNRRP